MPALKDNMVFHADGLIPVDPALGLRARAESFVCSQRWCTPSIFYGDQPEPEESESAPTWSMTFALGLDHVPATSSDWFADVMAIVEFLKPVARETDSEFILEYRLSDQLWYSETLDFVTGEPDEHVDLRGVRAMLEHLMQPRKSWWQRLLGR